MKPLKDRATEGRANPKGIPYLYLATDQETTLAEVRPWVGSLVSIGQFRTLRDLRFVNCTNDENGHRVFIGGEPSPPDREKAGWADINRAFGEPVTRGDDRAEYIPTQVLAELFKANGFDGVAYRSALGCPGHNIALFDLDAAELVNCSLFRVDGVKFEFSEAGNPHFIVKPDKAPEQQGG